MFMILYRYLYDSQLKSLLVSAVSGERDKFCEEVEREKLNYRLYNPETFCFLRDFG